MIERKDGVSSGATLAAESGSYTVSGSSTRDSIGGFGL